MTIDHPAQPARTEPAGRSAQPALSLIGAAKTFGPVVALADGTIQIEAGEIHALVGENGAGKSTLVKILAGLYTARCRRLHPRGRSPSPSAGSPTARPRASR